MKNNNDTQRNKYSDYAERLNASEKVEKWVCTVLGNYLAKNTPTTEEVEHIIDWAVMVEPKNIHNISYPQALKKTEKWNQQLQAEAREIKEKRGDTKTVLDFGDGFKIVQLIGENAYKREGKLMRHCVASYYGKDTRVYSLRDKRNNPHCTVEEDQQIKGKGNGDISPKYIDYIVRFLEWTGMDVRDGEMGHLGYERETFPEYCVSVLYRNKYKKIGEQVSYVDNVVVFYDIKKAVEYNGDKLCLFGGDAYFRNSEVTDLGKLTSIGGDANFWNSKITGLGRLTSVGGDADFEGIKIADLGNLTSIGGDADFRVSRVTDLGKLTSIGGNAYFRGSEVTDLGKLTSIGGDACFGYGKITDLGKLTSIGGYADFRYSKVTDLGNLTSIGEYAYFKESEVTDLGKLTSIGGNAYFGGSKITDLGKLTSIGGSADFRNSEVTDLGNLTSIGGHAYFSGSKITDLGKLTSIGGYADFGESKVTDKMLERLEYPPSNL